MNCDCEFPYISAYGELYGLCTPKNRQQSDARLVSRAQDAENKIARCLLHIGHNLAISFRIAIRRRDVLAVTSFSPSSVRRALVKMVLFAVERLHAAGPLFAVDASYCFTLEVGVGDFELRVSVRVRWSRHRKKQQGGLASFAAS